VLVGKKGGGSEVRTSENLSRRGECLIGGESGRESQGRKREHLFECEKIGGLAEKEVLGRKRSTCSRRHERGEKSNFYVQKKDG